MVCFRHEFWLTSTFVYWYDTFHPAHIDWILFLSELGEGLAWIACDSGLHSATIQGCPFQLQSCPLTKNKIENWLVDRESLTLH